MSVVFGVLLFALLLRRLWFCARPPQVVHSQGRGDVCRYLAAGLKTWVITKLLRNRDCRNIGNQAAS
jgi:hypothetical protein